MDNEFLDSSQAQHGQNGLENAILAVARSLNNIALALGDTDDEDESENEDYFIRDLDLGN